MKINKAYKCRLYPTETQKGVLSRWFGSCRFIYNYFLNERKIQYEQEGKSDNLYAQQKKLTELKNEGGYEWLYDVNSQTLQRALACVENAYVNFFCRRARFPKFRKKGSNQSFEVTQSVKTSTNRFFMPKFKNGIKCKFHREVEGKICSATISKYPSGKYYVSILTEQEITVKDKKKHDLGIDLGIESYITTSESVKYDNPRYVNEYKDKLKIAQQWLSRKKKGSRQFENQKLKVAKIQEKIANCRSDFMHKLSKELVDGNSVIYVEDLDVKNMKSYHSLNREIRDASWSAFVNMLAYKGKWYGCKVRKIDRWFPSSKTCNKCGYIHQGLRLSDRTWTCPNCGEVLDRDLNASKNILLEGTREYKSSGSGDYTDGGLRSYAT